MGAGLEGHLTLPQDGQSRNGLGSWRGSGCKELSWGGSQSRQRDPPCPDTPPKPHPVSPPPPSFGLAPAAPLQVHAPLAPNQSVEISLPLNTVGSVMKMDPLNNLQVGAPPALFSPLPRG